MRRKYMEVTDPQAIEEILRSATIGRVATTDNDGYPYITPVSFVYHEKAVYFHGAPHGEKLDNIARDPRVCFQVDIPLAYLDAAFDPQWRACKLHQFFHCVIIRGEASIVPDGPEKISALNALARKHEPGIELTWVSEDTPGYRACTVVRVRPVKLSAKSDLAQNRTAEERLAVARYLKSRNRPGDIETVKAFGFEPGEL